MPPPSAARLVAVGLLHGPAELLPVSSSAHAGLLLQGVGGERRKELEVALHAGALAALGLPRPRRWLVAATAPAALAGLLLEGPIERRLGTPRGIAGGLVAGGAAMALADALAARSNGASRSSDGMRPRVDLRRAGEPALGEPALGEALLLGAAQAAALVPGVSRHGAALTALRALGFERVVAHRISREASKPVLLGATVLKGTRAAGRRADIAPLLLAAAASAASTWAARRLLAAGLDTAPLWPFAVYRAGLAASVWRHG